MASKKNDVSTLEFTGMELMSDPPQYVYERKDGSRVNSFTAPSDDQLQSRSKSLRIMKDKFFKNIGSGAGSPIDESLSPADRKKLRDNMRKMDQGMRKKLPGKMKGGAMKAKGRKKGGAMKSKGYAKGGALTKEEARSLRKKSGAAVTKKEIDEMKIRKKTGAATTKKELDKMKKTSGKKRGGAMKAKGMAKGGMMKTKGMAKGGMMKSKGMAKGGAMKTKGGNKGGVKRNMRPPSSNKSGLYGR